MAASSPEPEKLEDHMDDDASKEDDGLDAAAGGSETADGGDGKEEDEVEEQEQEDQNEGDEEKDDGVDDDESKEDDDGALQIGGPIETDAYGLLDGIFEDPESGAHTRVTIPLTRFPATLGRSHDTEDPHFFGLGKKKALSRKQCMIYYRDAQGGKVQWDSKLQDMSYQKPDGSLDTAKLLHTKTEDLPQEGFFVIECLGKNRILVNKERVDQGKSAVLKSGASIRISSYMLYFLLPKDAAPRKPHFVWESVAPDLKRKKSPPPPITSNSSVVSSKDPNPSANKKSKATMGASFQAELDTLPVETLLDRMNTAINKNQWERRHQLIGSTISLHSVRDAAMDPDIQEEATLDGAGVSRSDIMTWVETSPKYKRWVEQMMTKMEARSYQAAITKSLLKAGYTRTGSSGRYIKWLLPADIEIKPVDRSVKKKPKKEKVEEEEEGGDEEGEGGDEEGEGGDEEGEGGDEEDAGEEEEEGGGGGGEEEEEEEDEEDEDGSKPAGSGADESGSEEDRTGGAEGEEDDEMEEEE
jgi:hypothetical protein